MAKKPVLQLMLLSCAAAGLMSCASAVNYSNAVNSWQGQSTQALYAKWGKPTEVQSLPNGNRELIYHKVERNRERSGMYWDAVPFVRVSPQTSKALVLSHTSPMNKRGDLFWCDTIFTINKSSMIIDTHDTGNNCVTTQKGEMRWSHHE